MKKNKITRWKLVGVFSTALLVGVPSLEAEALVFSLTAPSQFLVQSSCRYLANRYSPNEAAQEFIDLVKPQTPDPKRPVFHPQPLPGKQASFFCLNFAASAYTLASYLSALSGTIL